MFAKLLIANRGEIACRVIRTARRLGIPSVAVYSDADAGAAHVEMADEAWPIGPAPARQSYLCGDAIIEAALKSGATAIHPGYGFLSENAAFAEACTQAGLVFVGPPAEAIRTMGDKSRAKALMEQSGVPLIPGYHGADQSPATLAAAAARIGFPVLIKAAAGGGGKGMRVVEEAGRFAEELAAAKREAASAFGDDHVLIEKYLLRPRHVEMQIFADRHGHCLHLFERDCSLQRRHQKVLEEAPAPGMDPALRHRMGEAAIAAARAVGYVGAGTVEFLLAEDGTFTFMEMNTRLQVEHPVTEMITGLDLVEWQLRIAAGQPLPLSQEQVTLKGHAIEARLYAEDPERGFLPASGRLDHLRFPSPGVARTDTGVREGDRITTHYDPMIAKLIVHGEDRADAVRRLRAALAATEMAGVTTNADFLAAIARHPAYAEGQIDTGFIPRHQGELLRGTEPPGTEALAAACLVILLDRAEALAAEAARSADPYTPWARCDGWRLNDVQAETLTLRDSEAREHRLRVVHRDGGYLITVGTGGEKASASKTADGRLAVVVDGVRRCVGYARSGPQITLFLGGRTHRLSLVEPLPEATAEAVGGGITAPMPGTLIAVLVEPGARVTKGQPLAVMEAMKMEHTVKAPANGTVTALCYAVGDLVEEGTALVDFAAAEET